MADIRITSYGKMPADQFTAHPDNPKYHPQAQREALRGALNEIGWIAPVIVNKRTGYVIDGHERIFSALETNEDVPYVEIDISEDEEAYALATFDPIGYMAQHDREKLASLMDNVQSAEAGVQAMLAELAEREKLILPDEFKEYDESVADEVEMCECPNCGHKFPK